MKKSISMFNLILVIAIFASCGGSDSDKSTAKGMASLPGAENTIVGIAANSKDHTTLVKAVEAAGLVDSLANPGPLTVFAPTDAAFAQLPAGTVEGLLKPAKKNDLSDVLYYHTLTSSWAEFTNGEEIPTVNGASIKVTVKNGATYINDAKIIGSVKASNGMVHVVDKVLLPPAKK